MKLSLNGVGFPLLTRIPSKTWLAMKITFILLFCFNVQISAHVAAQNISLSNMRAPSLEKVFKEINRQTGYGFLYNTSLIKGVKRVDLDSVDGVSVERALDLIFKNLPLTYQITGKTIVVREKLSRQPLNITGIEKPDLQELQGSVIDSTSRKPLAGVTIQVRGTSIGTTTDVNGKFNLSVPDDAVIEVSYLGYNRQVIPVNGRSTIEVLLSSSSTSLDQLVVVGYGTQKKSDLTGSITSVSGDQIRDVPASSVAEALQGQAAGVAVTKGDGGPGSAANIIIRGAGDINGLSPLYIVDGVRMGTGNNFNISDIESIEILKDAASSAIYGAQAAGGVILITTKRGKLGKMNVNFNGSFGVRQPMNLIHLLNRDQFLRAKAAYGNDISGWGDPATLPNTDWIDQLFGNGKQQDYTLSISGASEKVNYYVSGNYHQEDGVRLDNWFKRYAIRVNSGYQLNSKLKVGENIYGWKTATNPTTNGEIPFRSVPTMAVRDSTNPLGGWAKQPPGSYFEGTNPVANELLRHNTDEAYGFDASVYLDWTIFEGLNFRATFGASIGETNSSQFYEAYNFGSLAKQNGDFTKTFNKYENLTANYVLTYDKTIGRHNFKLMAGYEALKNSSSDLSGSTLGFPVQVAESFAVSTQASSQRTATGGLGNSRVLSQFGRLNYGYADKYLLTANIRRDASTNFGPENRWGVFPSFSAAWRLSEEPFIKNNVSQISNLKIRGGYGVLGSDNIGQYLYESAYNSQSVTYLGNQIAQGWGIFKFPNPNIKWEEIHQTDIGLDASFWRDKVTLTLDWYSRQTMGMLYNVKTAPSAGVGTYNGSPASVPVNIGQVSNKGFEIAASYRAHVGDFDFKIGANTSFNHNLVLKLGQDTVPIISGFPGNYWNGSVSKTQTGHPMGQFYGYVVDGIYKTDAAVKERDVFQSIGTGQGDLIYRDIDHNGVINENDKTYIGNPWPKVTYAININASWKNFDLVLFFSGVYGVDIFDGTLSNTQNFVGDYNTTAKIFQTSFFDGKGLTNAPRVGYYSTQADGTQVYIRDPNGNYKNVSSYFVEDGSYLKLKNFQLGYNFPEQWISRMKLSSLRVFLMAQDLFTLTKYQGMDPELAGSVTARGIDNFQIYPHSRLLSIGLNVGF
jgi:TonB-linked SusC/RagA family outer membrane protein